MESDSPERECRQHRGNPCCGKQTPLATTELDPSSRLSSLSVPRWAVQVYLDPDPGPQGRAWGKESVSNREVVRSPFVSSVNRCGPEVRQDDSPLLLFPILPPLSSPVLPSSSFSSPGETRTQTGRPFYKRPDVPSVVTVADGTIVSRPTGTCGVWVSSRPLLFPLQEASGRRRRQ